MKFEWTGNTNSIEQIQVGTLFGFQHHRLGTQWAIRVDHLYQSGETRKGLVCLTKGYDDNAIGPAFFQLGAFSAKNAYCLPEAVISATTDRERIGVEYRFIDNLVPGIILFSDKQQFLIVAFNGGVQFLDLTTGTIPPKMPDLNSFVFFYAWDIILRNGDESRLIYRAKVELPTQN